MLADYGPELVAISIGVLVFVFTLWGIVPWLMEGGARDLWTVFYENVLSGLLGDG